MSGFREKFAAYRAELATPSNDGGYYGAANQLGHWHYGWTAAAFGIGLGMPWLVVLAYVTAYWLFWEVGHQGGGRENAIDAAFVFGGGAIPVLLLGSVGPVFALAGGGIIGLIAVNIYGIATVELDE